VKTSDFDYDLPKDLIAQTPLVKREESKLLILNRQTGLLVHEKFKNIIDYLEAGDVLVLNNTKVIPARLIGEKNTKAKIELLLIKEVAKDIWECLVKPVKRIKVGTELKFGEMLIGECVAKKEEGIALFKFKYEGVFLEVLEQLGDMPLPPYITEKLEKKERYQTVYAKEDGSVAAPTAGLHFTDEIIRGLKKKKVEIITITLHVGIGTFRPITVENPLEHKMHAEFYQVDDETVRALNLAKKNNKRIISVGTTTTRTLETIYNDGLFLAKSGWTDLFIYPGYRFQAIDGLLTNFHLPKSTLLMLVSAFSSREYILNAYQEAVSQKYRFFSFGDAMLII